MDIVAISSKNNEVVKNVSKLLKSSSERKKQGLFVIEGIRLCLDAFLNNVKVSMCLITEDCLKKSPELQKFIDELKSVYIISHEVAEKISDTKTTQGVFCVCEMDKKNFAGGSILNEINPHGRYIALKDVQNPDNLGAVARTAEALGLDGMIVSGGCDIYNPKALRASMGALMRFTCIQSDNMYELVNFLKEKNMVSYACVVRGYDLTVENITRRDGVVMFIGNEANGLDDEFSKKCDMRITIPMKGRAESLNAAEAATIVMWEISK